MATEVYWTARDLDHWTGVGNHHFILIVLAAGDNLAYPAMDENGRRFVTLGAFKKPVGGMNRLIFEHNNDADVKSVREFIDPDKHTKWWKSDFDLERHRVSPPGKLSGLGFAQKCVQLAKTYKTNEIMNPVRYTALDDNCAAWVNCLLEAARVPYTIRLQAGEFWGVDWGEEDRRIAHLFQSAKPQTVKPPSGKSGPPTPAAKLYTVKAGDSLSKISKQFYGRVDRWQKIYQTNKQVIGANPNLIRPGQQLTIPK